MKIDNALREFTETYDRNAIESIQNISEDFGLTIHRKSMKLFNIKESFDKFSQYIKSYANYVVENVNNPEISSRESISYSVNKFINEQLFKESDVLYSDLPSFIESYVNGINELNSAIAEAKNIITESDEADLTFAGDINDYADAFMTRLDESFTPAMNDILWASGYNAKQRFAGKMNGNSKPVFL
jgi:hypothetical protein